MKKAQLTRALLSNTARAHRINYIYHEVNNQGNHKGRGNDHNRCANDSDKKIHKMSSIFKDENVAKSVTVFIVEYAQSAPGSNRNVKVRCLFGWLTDANGVCTPPRSQCEPDFVGNEAGECVRPDKF